MQYYLRRGTKAELDSITLGDGELGFTTDTKEVFIGDGISHYLIGKVIVKNESELPTAGVSGRIFFAIDTKKVFVDDGYSWTEAGYNNLDNITDGVNYGKVLKSELFAGKIAKIYASGADVEITADTVNNHLNNTAIHRSINDSGVSSTDLWSASKIADEINAKLAGLSWTTPAAVLKMVSDASQGGSPPVSPEFGDAYVANNWGTGYTDNVIYEFDDTDWVEIQTLVIGTKIVVKDSGSSGSFSGYEDEIGIYNGSGWDFTAPIENLTLLISGNGSQYENSGFTYSDAGWISFGSALQLLPDEVSIVINASNKLAVGTIDGGTF